MLQDNIVIEKAEERDSAALYQFAKGFPELRVSATHEFMDRDEFEDAVKNPKGVFLCAIKEEKPIGFIYSNADDMEKQGLEKKWACLVYLAVDKDFQGQGIAGRLYAECVKLLKERGITHLYGWANNKSDGAIVNFMKKQGFAEGHKYVWMDKEL